METKLSRSRKSAWAMGSIADVYMTNALNYLAFPIYNMGLGVDPRLLGWALGLPRVWDAVSDPLMGNISDNFHSRLGRRRPFIIIGALLCFLMFGLIWSPPTFLSVTGIGWFFMVMTFLYYTAYTIFAVPWSALGLELTSDYNERTRVQAYRTVFQAVGGLGLGAMWYLSQKWGGGNDVVGVRIVGWVFGGLIVACALFPALFCREKLQVQAQPKIAFWPAIRATFSNRVFLLLIAVTVCVMLGIFMVNSFSLYINTCYVFGGDKEGVAKLNMVANFAFQGAGLALVPLIAAVATRIGKKPTLIGGLLMVVVAYGTSWWFYTPENPYLQLITLALAAPGLSCMWTIASSMLADICDLDEKKTGRRREGMFGASYSWACKAGIALTMVLSGYMLNWSGYNAEIEVQPESVITTMRLLYMFVPMGFVGLAALLVCFYPLSEKRIHELQKELNRGISYEE
ncbi:MFS transporter [Tichowtungia aerotolerans]|uniref:MFS transporter n=1 Tax=Tichowtungia aerotolerans TaxID=2697043 RepID=A0A6P1M4R7_9BACT|nr:MFS transporter [Tichowtungia aerotolerans]QHI68841.1 MFS transporter [Tichowtungia aerotolerans]